MAKPNTLADDEMSLHIDRVRIGRLPGSTKQEKKAASTSKQLLAESYIPLVKNIAEKYVHKLGRDEARSAAYYGLTLAMRSWNPDKGALPSWIRLYCKSSLIREVDKLNIIKLPQEIAPKKAMLNHLRAQGYDDTIIGNKLNLTTAKIQDLDTLPGTTAWFDNVEADTIEDGSTAVNILLSHLTNKEKQVIELRFGIGHDGFCHNYNEISELTSIPTQTIQQIEARALARLKSVS